MSTFLEGDYQNEDDDDEACEWDITWDWSEESRRPVQRACMH